MDLISLLCCLNCGSRFNSENMLPLSLICGHTCCKACLVSSHTFTCPSDSITETRGIAEIPPSALILQLIQTTKPSYACYLHNRPLEFYCLPCKQLLCPKCIMQHSLHEYKDIEQTDDIVNALKRNFETYYQVTMNNYEKVSQETQDLRRAKELVNQGLKAAQKELKEKYNKKKEELERRRKIEEQELEYKIRPSLRYIEEHKERIKELLMVVELERENAINSKMEVARHKSNLAVLYNSETFNRNPAEIMDLNFD